MQGAPGAALNNFIVAVSKKVAREFRVARGGFGDAVLKSRRRWRRIAPDSLGPSLVAPHAPSMARDGPAQPTATAT